MSKNLLHNNESTEIVMVQPKARPFSGDIFSSSDKNNQIKNKQMISSLVFGTLRLQINTRIQ